MKKYSILFCFFISAIGLSQEPVARFGVSNSYVPLEIIRDDGTVLTKEDSLNFRYINGDTLVRIRPGMIYSPANGVKVRYMPKDSLFMEIYEDVVFGQEPRSNGKASTLKLWKEEVKVYFDPTVPESHHWQLMNFASQISKGIDSLKISEVSRREDSNYLVSYWNDSTAADPDPRVTNELAGFHLKWNGRQELNTGSIKINTYKIPSTVTQITLLRYYFLKTLGYFKNSELLNCKSYLSACFRGGPIADQDREILKYHYSYNNRVGTDRESFKEFHQNAKKTLEKRPSTVLYIVHKDHP